MSVMTRKPRGVHKLTATAKHVGKDVPDEIGLPLIWARIKTRLRVADSGCWLYTGYIMPLGYVQVSYHSQRTWAHHLSYRANKGPIPEGMRILHSCDVRHCLNPAHLRIGTQQENIRECVAKGRQASRRKTHCPHGHSYAEHGRHYLSDKCIQQATAWRSCRVCQRIRLRRKAGWPAHMLALPPQPRGVRPAFENPKEVVK